MVLPTTTTEAQEPISYIYPSFLAIAVLAFIRARMIFKALFIVEC